MSTTLDPEQEKRAQEKLARWIELDHKIVTYREISREVGVNINAAKNILARYLQANPASFPTYILTGSYLDTFDREATPTQQSENKSQTPSKPTPKDDPMDIVDTTPKAVKSESNGMTVDPAEIKPEITKLKSKRDDPYPVENEKVQKRGMMLVGGNELLQDKIELFVPANVKIQIYSLSSARISDPAHYLPPTLRLRQRDNYVDPGVVGSVTGDFEMAVTAEKLGESSKSASKTKASAPVKPTKVEASLSKSIFGNKTKSRESSVKPEEPAKGKIIKKKKLRSESPSDTETEKTIEKPKVVKGQSGTVTMPVNKSAKPLQKLDDAETEKMIMESFFDDEAAGIPSSDAMVADEDATAADETSMKVYGKGISGSRPIVPQKRDSMADGRDDDRETTPTPAGGRAKAEGRVRKKRRVVKSETKMNDKGYIVTEDVSGEESYSSDGGTPQPPKAKKTLKAAPKLTKSSSTTSMKEEAPPKPKAAAPKTSVAAKPKKKGQQTLAGFFKKA